MLTSNKWYTQINLWTEYSDRFDGLILKEVIKRSFELNIYIYLLFFKGRSINMKSAGIIGRNGPQSKQPFLVAFFKASGVLLRSVRAAGGKKKNHNRNKSINQQESSQAPKAGGK